MSDLQLSINDLPIGGDRDGAWRAVLAAGPVLLTEAGYFVGTHEEVEQSLRAPEVYSSQKSFDRLNSPLPLVPLAFDPPAQTRYRKILQPFFSPRAIRPLEPRLRANLRAQLEAVAEKDGCDFVAEIAETFPVHTFLAFFGLPDEMLEQFMAWKNAIIEAASFSGVPMSAEPTPEAIALFTYLFEMVAQRRGVPGDDILSQLLALPVEDGLTDEEAIGLCFLFVLAGLDTVAGALGMGMQRLALDPKLQQRIVADPTVIPAAVEELVRLDPPAPFLPRMAVGETTLGGTTIPDGAEVTINLATANRDEATCPHAYDVDFDRGENPHASFGLGPHRCLGSHLARLEMRLVYEEWHRLIPEYSIAPGADPQVKWPSGTLGLTSLPLVFGAAS